MVFRGTEQCHGARLHLGSAPASAQLGQAGAVARAVVQRYAGSRIHQLRRVVDESQTHQVAKFVHHDEPGISRAKWLLQYRRELGPIQLDLPGDETLRRFCPVSARLPACPATSLAKSGASAGVTHAMSTGTHRSPYLSCWKGARCPDGASSVAPSSTNRRPVAAETAATALLTAAAPPEGAPCRRVT